MFTSGQHLAAHEAGCCIMGDSCESCVNHLMDSKWLNVHTELLASCGAFGGTSDISSSSNATLLQPAKSFSKLPADYKNLETRLRDSNYIGGNFCSLCTLTFANVRSFQSHMYVSHHEVTLWNCPSCSRGIVSKRKSLQLGRELGHSKAKCENCGTIFSSVNTLAKHQAQCKQLRFPYACFRCRRGFVHQLEAMDHVASRCKYRRIASPSSRIVKISTRFRYDCDFPFCGAQFTEVVSRTKHFHNVHFRRCKSKKLTLSHINRLLREGPEICDICGMEIYNQRTFSTHLRKIHGIKSAQPCLKCGFRHKAKFCVKIKGASSHDWKCKNEYSFNPQFEDRDDKYYFGNMVMQGSCATDSSNEPQLGKLQDARVTSSEMDLQSNTGNSLIGISEFCLRGEIPHADVDSRRVSENNDSSVKCNEEATGCTAKLVVNNEYQLGSPIQPSQNESKENDFEGNIFNRLFSDLLRDSFQVESCSEKQQTTIDVNNSLICDEMTNTCKDTERGSSGHDTELSTSANKHIFQFIDTDNFDRLKDLDKQQDAEFLVSNPVPSSFVEEQPCLEVNEGASSSQLLENNTLNFISPVVTPARQESPASFPDVPISTEADISQGDSLQNSEIEKDTLHSTKVASKTKHSPSFKVLSSTCNDKADFDLGDHFDLSVVDCLDLNDNIYGNDHANEINAAGLLDDESDKLEKMLECPSIATFPPVKPCIITTSPSDIGSNSHGNAEDVSCSPMKNSTSDLLEDTKTSDHIESCPQIGETCTEFGLQSDLPTNCELNETTGAEEAASFVSEQANDNVNSIDVDSESVRCQTLAVNANDSGDLIGKVKDTSFLRGEDCSTVANLQNNKELNLGIEDISACSETEVAISRQQRELNLGVENNVAEVGNPRKHKELISDVEDADEYSDSEIEAAILSSMMANGLVDGNDVYCMEGEHIEDVALGQISIELSVRKDGSDDGGESFSVLACNDCDDGSDPELEADILSAMYNYMKENKETKYLYKSIETADEEEPNSKGTKSIKTGVSSKNSGKELCMLSTRKNPVTCAAVVAKDVNHRKQQVQQLDKSKKAFVESQHLQDDPDVSSCVFYEEWMTEKSPDCIVAAQKHVEISTGLALKGRDKANVCTQSESGTVLQPTKHLNMDASELSSDEIRMRLGKQNKLNASLDKVSSVSKVKFNGENHSRLNKCRSTALASTGTAVSVTSCIHKQLEVADSSDTITASKNKTESDTRFADGSCSAKRISDSTAHAKHLFPNKIVINSKEKEVEKNLSSSSELSSTAAGDTAEKDVPEWEKLLKDCDSSSVGESQAILPSLSQDRVAVAKKRVPRKLQSKPTNCNLVPQQLFEFHKLSGLTQNKKKDGLGAKKKMPDAAVADQLREKNSDPSIFTERESSNREEILTSQSVENNPDVGAEINAENVCKKRKLSIRSPAVGPNNGHSAAGTTATEVTSKDNVPLAEDSLLKSECLSRNVRGKPRFMRSRSCDADLEKTLEESLLNAEKLVVKVPMKYWTNCSSTLTTICPETLSSLSEAFTESVSSDNGSSSCSDAEDRELEKKILAKEDELKELQEKVQTLKERISKRKKLLRHALQVKKRCRLKGRSFVSNVGRGQFMKRLKDINSNAAVELKTIIKNSKVYSRLDKFESNRLVVRLNSIKSKKVAEELISRTWYCGHCSMNFEVRRCAVYLSRC